MEIPFTERGITVEEVGFCCCSVFWWMEIRIRFRHFKFEMPLRYPDGNIKYITGYSSLDFKRASGLNIAHESNQYKHGTERWDCMR